MTKEELKREIKEILELVKVCPQNLQEKCFEILLNQALLKKVTGGGGQPEPAMTHLSSASIPDEIRKRIKAFGAKFELTEDAILKVFGVDELGNVNIEITDLKTKKMAQQQRRLALLIGVRHQFMEGSFDVPTEELREMCVNYSAYDAPNFSSSLKKFKDDIFAGFKPSATNKLSARGTKEAAELTKELAS